MYILLYSEWRGGETCGMGKITMHLWTHKHSGNCPWDMYKLYILLCELVHLNKQIVQLKFGEHLSSVMLCEGPLIELHSACHSCLDKIMQRGHISLCVPNMTNMTCCHYMSLLLVVWLTLCLSNSQIDLDLAAEATKSWRLCESHPWCSYRGSTPKTASCIHLPRTICQIGQVFSLSLRFLLSSKRFSFL